MRRRPSAELARLSTNVPLVIGLGGILALATVALFGPQLAPRDPLAQRLVIFFPDGSFDLPPIPPEPRYWLGTDPLGRDVLSRLLWGARLTLTVTLLGLAGRAALGLAVGMLAAWRRGLVDRLATYLVGAVGGFPQLLLAVVLAVALKDLGVAGFVLATALVGWPELAQFVRGEILRVRAAPHLEAARALGLPARRVLVDHVLRNVAPQVVGVLALEAGAVLLLLAELGFIGLFISGGTYYLTDAGTPALPIRDRAPEWGQMLAGARAFLFAKQWVLLIPALAVVAAVFAFNLFAEGLRAASDPFSRKSLSGRTFALLGRTVGALGLVGVLAFAVVTAGATEIGFEDGLARAQAAAERLEPGAGLLAAVVRFQADAHAMRRPERLNYYFRRGEEGSLLRVGFERADPNGMEVKPYHNDDELDLDDLKALGPAQAHWTAALNAAEAGGGQRFRALHGDYVVRVVLEARADWPAPLYRVRYTRSRSRATFFEIAVDARSGSTDIPFPLVRTMSLRARAELVARHRLDGPAIATTAVATFAARAPDARPSGIVLDPRTPRHLDLHFVRPDAARALVVTYDLTRGTRPEVADPELVPPPAPAAVPLPAWLDLAEIFGLVEERGGREARAAFAARGAAGWVATVVVTSAERGAVAHVTYEAPPAPGRVKFVVDLASGEVRPEGR